MSELKHVAIIMDGNGRWAEARGLPRTAGHRQGLLAARRVVRAAREMELPFLTLFAFSADNFRRPPSEVSNIFALLELYLSLEGADLANHGIRLRISGDLTRVPERCRRLLAEVCQLTRAGRRMALTLAIGYGGREELAEACRAIARRVERGHLRAADVTAERIGAALGSADLPDPDLVIRTAGEQRLSNFMIWQLAYAELVFSPLAWPDFGPGQLVEAVQEYARRRRTYGRLQGAHPC